MSVSPDHTSTPYSLLGNGDGEPSTPPPPFVDGGEGKKESSVSLYLRALANKLKGNQKLGEVCGQIVVYVGCFILAAMMWANKIDQRLEAVAPFFLFTLVGIVPFLFLGGGLSFMLMLQVIVKSAAVQVLTIYIASKFAEYMGVGLKPHEMYNASEELYWRYVAVGVVIALLEAISLYLICQQTLVSGLLSCTHMCGFYGMLAAVTMGLVHWYAKTSVDGLANLPPLNMSHWGTEGVFALGQTMYWIFGMSFLILAGWWAGVGSVTGGAVLVPFVIRALGVVGAALYERFYDSAAPMSDGMKGFLQ